jgi:hypothetical protein
VESKPLELLVKGQQQYYIYIYLDALENLGELTRELGRAYIYIYGSGRRALRIIDGVRVAAGFERGHYSQSMYR